MPSTGSCPNCGASVRCAVTKGTGTTKCPKCKVTVVFTDGRVTGTR